MKSFAALLGSATFAAAVLAVTIGGFRRTVDLLETRLDRSESELALTRESMARLRREPPPAPPEPPRPGERLDELLRDVLAPSVLVSARGSVGGGTVLFSRPHHTYVATAWHVVQKIVDSGADAETREAVEVSLYDAKGEVRETVDGDLVGWDEKHDLALLRLRSVRESVASARLASRASLQATRVFTPIYAVGCPLGHDPLPTLGEIATLHKEVNGERFWMMNAPTIFGNSGGGIFHRETRELLGVSVMVCTYDGAVATPVPHLGILVSLESVYDWLDGLGYGFIYDSGYPIEDGESGTPSPVPPSSGR